MRYERSILISARLGLNEWVFENPDQSFVGEEVEKTNFRRDNSPKERISIEYIGSCVLG